jgi:hypothetical protein
MRFYYFSLFSWMAWALYGAIAVTVLSLLWARLLKFRFRNPVHWVLIAAVLIAPWSEELWIAYNFDRLCRKDGGVVINKTVEVDGFYDDTTGWGPRQLDESGYRYVESKGILDHRLRRVERLDDAARDRAIAAYVAQSRGGVVPEGKYLDYQVNDRVRVYLAPDRRKAWRVVRIEKPTARYWFESRWGGEAVAVAHKIVMGDSIVRDSQTGDVLARYVRYSRDPYWFYIGLGRTPYGCDGPDGGPNAKHSSLIYRDVLRPLK